MKIGVFCWIVLSSFVQKDAFARSDSLSRPSLETFSPSLPLRVKRQITFENRFQDIPESIIRALANQRRPQKKKSFQVYKSPLQNSPHRFRVDHLYNQNRTYFSPDLSAEIREVKTEGIKAPIIFIAKKRGEKGTPFSPDDVKLIMDTSRSAKQTADVDVDFLEENEQVKELIPTLDENTDIKLISESFPIIPLHNNLQSNSRPNIDNLLSLQETLPDVVDSIDNPEETGNPVKNNNFSNDINYSRIQTESIVTPTDFNAIFPNNSPQVYFANNGPIKFGTITRPGPEKNDYQTFVNKNISSFVKIPYSQNPKIELPNEDQQQVSDYRFKDPGTSSNDVIEDFKTYTLLPFTSKEAVKEFHDIIDNNLKTSKRLPKSIVVNDKVSPSEIPDRRVVNNILSVNDLTALKSSERNGKEGHRVIDTASSETGIRNSDRNFSTEKRSSVSQIKSPTSQWNPQKVGLEYRFGDTVDIKEGLQTKHRLSIKEGTKPNLTSPKFTPREGKAIARVRNLKTPAMHTQGVKDNKVHKGKIYSVTQGRRKILPALKPVPVPPQESDSFTSDRFKKRAERNSGHRGVPESQKWPLGSEKERQQIQRQNLIDGAEGPSPLYCHRHFENEYFADLPSNCTKFHVCYSGRKATFSCPKGTAFSQEHKVCVWKDDMKCG